MKSETPHHTTTSVPNYIRSYTLNKLLIKNMEECCKKRGIDFMLVVIDEITYILSIEEQYRSVTSSFDWTFIKDDMKTYLELLKIEYIGLDRVFRQIYVNEGGTFVLGALELSRS